MPRTAVELRWRVIDLHDMGIKVLARSRQLGIKRSTVYNILKRHTARPHDVIQAYLQNASIDVLLWPSKNPDLNIIENIWSHIARQTNSMNQMPRNAAELRQVAHTEWRQLTQTRIWRLIASIRRRLRAVVATQGEHTCY